MALTGRNIEFPIYNADGSSFNGLVIHKATLESSVMSLGDKLTGDVYYKDNNLAVTMNEYVDVDGVHYKLVSPPTIVREGMVSDNSDLKGMTKYSFVFYHPMYMLGNFPFTDVAVDSAQSKYLSQNKTFSWVGNLLDFIAKLNANLVSTQWLVSYNFTPQDESQWQKATTISGDVLSFDNSFISDALKKAYETWEIPYVVEQVASDDDEYSSGKRFRVVFGFPNQEILDSNNNPFVFQFGQGVGLKNNSRNPRNNKIVTRIVGSGSENNIPYGYPQIIWTGDSRWEYTKYIGEVVYDEDDKPTNDPAPDAYPIYDGIANGQSVKLIKHPFTRTSLMPSIYVETVNKKVNPYATNYDPSTVIVDYYDATQEGNYPNPCDPSNPSVEIHKFDDIKPELGEASIVDATPYDNVKANPLEGAISIATFLAQIQADLATPNNVTNQNERVALEVLYNVLNTDDGERHFANQGGSYTFKCDITCDSDYYYVKYVSDNINYDVVCVKSGHVVTPTWNDDMDDNGEYVQSYFKITLPRLDFDLYACASITEKMDINMRSGACIGCTFPIQVDWEDYKRNFYNADGEFDPVIHTTEGDGHVRYGSKYPDTRQGQVTLIVQKDLDTFGTIMPNVYQQPHSGDKFVILGISLPTSYVTNAQTRLDSAMMEYMLENNVHYFDYPLKFDEFMLAQNVNILNQIHTNCIVRFLYQGVQNALYVKQLTIKYGDKVLPQYDITLTDDIEVTLNQIGQVTDDVSRMRVQLNEVQKYYQQGVSEDINTRLSKIGDDVAQGRITFQQGLNAAASVIFSDEVKSENFRTGLYEGRGWRIDNLGNAEFESARVRSYLEVVELLVNRMRAQEGDTMFTDNDQIDRVESVGDNTYILSLKLKYDGYVTAQMYGNIIKGTINTLAAKQAGVSDETLHPSGQEQDDGGNTYYTSWMQVIGTHTTDNTLGVNQIRVVLYGDEDEHGDPIVPSGHNFPPCELMTVARWGCWQNPNEQGISSAEKQSRTRRQQIFYISTSEGRIVKLNGVNTPILRDTNYGMTLGTLPDFVRNWSIGSRLIDGRDYLYAQGVVVGDFIKVTRDGDPISEIVDCGEWVDGAHMPINPDTQQPYEPSPQFGVYYVNQYNSTTMQWETHDVWHLGHKWRCHIPQPVVSGGVATYYEPQWNSPYWTMVEGSDVYSLEFVSSNGYSFRRGYVDTTIEPHLVYGNNEDITSQIAAGYWMWQRCEERNWNDGEPIFTPSDVAWNDLHIGVKNLHITNNQMPSAWSSANKTIFICKVTIIDGNSTTIVENQVIS